METLKDEDSGYRIESDLREFTHSLAETTKALQNINNVFLSAVNANTKTRRRWPRRLLYIISISLGLYLQKDGLGAVPEMFNSSSVLAPDIADGPADYGDATREKLEEVAPLMAEMLLACVKPPGSSGTTPLICSYHDRSSGKTFYVIDGRPADEAVAAVSSPAFDGCENIKKQIIAGVDPNLAKALRLESSPFVPANGQTLAGIEPPPKGSSC